MAYQRRHPDPVFMFGALRSGTTLLRLMLLHHSKIQSPGEADYLFDHLKAAPEAPHGWDCNREELAADWKFQMAELRLPEGPEGGDLVYALTDVIHDQEPGSIASVTIHRNAPVMASLFPEAKYIHLLRDPRDSARSAVGMGWDGNSYYGVRHWLDTEENWDASGLSEDQVLTLRFEDLMEDLETGLTEICKFIGLEFEPGMLEYHRNSTYGPPDPSISQKWRVQATPREIARIEGRVGPLLQSRGYQSVGAPVVPGVLEKLWLKADNLLRRWRFNIRRYGFGLFFGHHLARFLRLRPLADRLAARQLNIKIQNLK